MCGKTTETSVVINQRVQIEVLQEENARLKAAIEWACDELIEGQGKYSRIANELQHRAFPPQEEEWEDVEVQAIRCKKCGCYGGEEWVERESCGHCSSTEVIIFKGTDRIPKRKKVTRREELQLSSGAGGSYDHSSPCYICLAPHR